MGGLEMPPLRIGDGLGVDEVDGRYNWVGQPRDAVRILVWVADGEDVSTKTWGEDETGEEDVGVLGSEWKRCIIR